MRLHRWSGCWTPTTSTSHDALPLDLGGWWSYLRDDPSCCPPQGTPIPDGTTDLEAERIGAGMPAVAADVGSEPLPGHTTLSRTGMHDLRHFYASLLIPHGESVKTVQARLGHAFAVETLDTYSHLWPDSDDRTREAVDAVLLRTPADNLRTKGSSS